MIGVCARYIHSTDAVFDIRDYYSARQLLKECITHLNHHQIEVLKIWLRSVEQVKQLDTEQQFEELKQGNTVFEFC